MFKRLILACCLVPSTLLIAHAEDAGIVTDRPDQTESPVVLDPGVLQIETGFVYTSDDDARSLALPTTLTRVGVAKRLELRFEVPGIEKDLLGDASGLADPAFGAKLRLWEEAGWRPEAALLVATTLPVGEDEFTSGRFDPDFRFSFAHTLSDRVGLGYNLGMSWETRSETTRTRLFGGSGTDRDTGALVNYTITTGIGLTERLGCFIEAFGDISVNADAGAAHYLDGGFTWCPRENLQFDVSAGIGLSDAADDFFAGAGVSVRLPR